VRGVAPANWTELSSIIDNPGSECVCVCVCVCTLACECVWRRRGCVHGESPDSATSEMADPNRRRCRRRRAPLHKQARAQQQTERANPPPPPGTVWRRCRHRRRRRRRRLVIRLPLVLLCERRSLKLASTAVVAPKTQRAALRPLLMTCSKHLPRERSTALARLESLSKLEPGSQRRRQWSCSLSQAMPAPRRVQKNPPCSRLRCVAFPSTASHLQSARRRRRRSDRTRYRDAASSSITICYNATCAAADRCRRQIRRRERVRRRSQMFVTLAKRSQCAP
jgi:hypothetical protein